MLSPDQIKARQGKLTASRVAVLMRGDAEGIMRLYKEMIGEEQEENLDDVWAVQLGSATEQVNLDWFERKQKVAVTRRGEVYTHSTYAWAACTLDGWVQEGFRGFPVETKHVGGREPLEVIIDRYQPQMQWQMEVTNTDKCALSVIMGASEPVVEFIDRDDDYVTEMIKRGRKFMACVAARVAPVALPAVPSPTIADKLYDMTGNNQWSDSAGRWLETKEATQINKDAEKVLKAMVPGDAKLCSGHLVRISRDRANRLSLREDK